MEITKINSCNLFIFNDLRTFWYKFSILIMMRRVFLFFLSFCFFFSPVFSAIDTIAVDVGISVFKTMPLGVVPFAEKSGKIEWGEAPPHQILESDANLSGRFEVISSPKFDLVTFSRARAKFYVTGSAELLANGKVKLSCYLYASQTKQLVFGENYEIAVQNVREAMHLFFDQVVFELWGERGVASTKLAWVRKIDGVKQVIYADYDGYRRRQATNDSALSMMPVWALGNNKLIFVSFRNEKPQLHVKDLDTKRVRRIYTEHKQSFSPAVNPITGEILFSVIRDGKTDLYLGDAEGKKSRRISYLKSSQTSPAWSPRATEILFTSDRGGGPQIYVMGRDGSDVRRVTFMGRYNEKAAWSPTGDRIVYTSMDNGKMNIYTCAFDGSDIVQLTSNAGNNEHPTWSPDGNLIAFASDRSGTYQIYIMRRDGSNVTQITKQGENTSPTWSWYDSPPPTSKKEGKK